MRNLRLIVHSAMPAGGEVASEEIEAWLHARLDVLEPREEQLDELVNAGEASAELRAELERVRAELTFCLETLADLGS